VIGSLAVLALGLFSSFFWFFIPAAVAISLRSSKWPDRLILGILFAIHISSAIRLGAGSLEILSILQLFGLGWLLRSITYKKGNFHYIVYTPLALGALTVFAVYFGEWVSGNRVSFLSWCHEMVQSSLSPAINETKGWSESWMGLYDHVLLPILERGFVGFFSFVVSLIFFINAAIENMFRTSRKTTVTWRGFPYWRSHDLVLVGLVIGLALLAINHTLAPFRAAWLAQIGWHFLILSLFPILIQGASLASFLIPRVGAILFLFIFTLLLVQPLPVLLLAGFCDLWFDLRSKLKFEPRGEDERS
jgi:hypothetical protein